MNKKMECKSGNPYPLGISKVDNYINFSFSAQTEKECGIILYANSSREMKIPFLPQERVGSIYCKMVAFKDGKSMEDIPYNFYCGDKTILDPYARKLMGHEKWGKAIEKAQLCGVISFANFDWEQDRNPKIPYSESILYCLHARGFTRHRSSKVTAPGTFLGIREKIPYLKELGITAVECLPIYEFDEIEIPKEENKNTMSYAVEHYAETPEEEKECQNKVNYWGFKEGYYFAPKASYAKNASHPEIELKELIRALHKQNMEFIMQFYFPKSVKPAFLLEVLRYWVLEYHIDGIHLQGEHVPTQLIATDPLFSDTKLMYYDFPCDQIYEEGEPLRTKNLASYQDNFMYAIRKYLKSDEDTLQPFLYQMRQNPGKEAVIHYITNYNGYTLMDLVSYDQKHNEPNGENNKDGNNYNFSWNCGVEGPSRKKNILKLRMKQMKNAFIFSLLAQGTPMILSGDEFGNSQNGNNNAYCQDNAISWLNWQLLDKNAEIYQFVKMLIQLRLGHPILRREAESKMMDSLSCGYPDVSYHSEEVWRPVIDNYNRHIAIMYCGKYEKTKEGLEDSFFYIAYNMHWIPHTFSLPNLPKDQKWKPLLSTDSDCDMEQNEKMVDTESQIIVDPRSIIIMMSQSKEKPDDK